MTPGELEAVALAAFIIWGYCYLLYRVFSKAAKLIKEMDEYSTATNGGV